ncbi:hypothetical protein, partial [Escherichia coli]|uniref:hypothetical protein n=1 Tax=Escherichia coli TaxID=562 RepID=UPI003CE7924F
PPVTLKNKPSEVLPSHAPDKKIAKDKNTPTDSTFSHSFVGGSFLVSRQSFSCKASGWSTQKTNFLWLLTQP